MISGFISMSFYPALSKCFKESKESLQRVWNYQMETMILLFIPVVAGGIILAPWVIEIVYNDTYLPAILAFQLLMIMAGICFLQSPFNHILIATDQQKKLFKATACGAIMNVVLNLVLIPKFSLYGAAASTVITWLVLLFVCFYFTRRYTPVDPFKFKFLIIKNIISTCSRIVRRTL